MTNAERIGEAIWKLQELDHLTPPMCEEEQRLLVEALDEVLGLLQDLDEVANPSSLASRVSEAFAGATRDAVAQHLENGRTVRGVRDGRPIEIEPGLPATAPEERVSLGELAIPSLASLLFLDFDGVLNSEAFLRSHAGGVVLVGKDWDSSSHLDPERIAVLNRVIRKTGALIVISSSWRLMHTPKQLAKMLFGAGLKGYIIGQTPDIPGAPRSHEIAAYLHTLAHHPWFAIVDDDHDAGIGYEKHFVQTSFSGGGLLDEHADRLIRILNGEP